VCALSLLLCARSYGQSGGVLKGKVTSAERKEPLSSATVRSTTNPNKGTVTDIDGIYSLVLDTGYQTLYCEYLGAQPDTFIVYIKTNAITEKNIMLATSSEELKTVVVSSGKFSQKLEELTVSMEVLKPALINNKNTTSIETALEQVPGLSIIDNDPQIRGGSGFTFGVGSRVAIVVDGIPMLSGDAGRPEWSYLPVENIEQVEVIKGSSSVLYGSSAINGVISIRTAYPRTEPKTMINVSAGGYSAPPSPAENWYKPSTLPLFSNVNFLHSRIINKNLDLVIGGNFNVDPGYIGPAPKFPALPNDLKKALLLTDSIPTFSKNDMLHIRGRINVNLRYRNKKVEGLYYGVNTNAMVNKTNMVLAWLDDSAGLYRGYPGAVFLEKQTFFNIDPYIKYDKGNGVSHSLVTRVFHTDDQITNNQSTRGTLYYSEYQLQRKYTGIGLTFTGGVVSSLAQTRAQLYDSSGTPDNRTVNAAGYLQADKKMWDVLNLSGGVRYEYFKTNNLPDVSQPIFRAGASLKVLRGTWIRTSIGDGFRYPTITERYISTKAGMFGVFPNPGLQPETSRNFEIGLKQGFKFGDCMGYLDIAGFQQNYHNTIEYLFGQWNPKFSLVGFKFVNTGDSRVSGIDISLACATPERNKKFGLMVLAGYTYINPVSLTPDRIYARIKTLGGPIDSVSFRSSSMNPDGNVLKYRFKHLLKADAEVRIYKFSVGGSYRYYSKMQNIDKAFSDIEQLTQLLPQLPPILITEYWKSHNGFHVIDARASYKIDEHQKLSVIANNLLNTPYFLRPLKVESPRNVAVQWVWTM
jgi:outer membrane cobalamin receptor